MSRSVTMYEAAAERLALPMAHIADVCDFRPADTTIACDRLRVTTWEMNTDTTALVDWRPDGPPPPGTPGWPLRADVIRVSGPVVPLGLVSVWDQPDSSRILVVSGFHDWVVATHLLRSAGVVGGLGVVTVPETVEVLVAMGITPRRIVVVMPHFARRRHRKRVREVIRSLRAEHPSVSVLWPEVFAWDIADGWRAHGSAWKDVFADAIRDAQPGYGATIPTPVGPSLKRSAAGHSLLEQPLPDHGTVP